MSTADDHAQTARQLLAARRQALLSTHSLEHAGFPFGSLAPYVLGQDGLPLLLLSHLSQHTRNADADPRSGLTVVEHGDGDVQQLGRLSAVGELRADSSSADSERYFACFPHTRPYFEQLGFRFYRFAPRHWHWNGGFATARWFGNDRIVRANPLTPGEQQRIIDHMNGDHPDALRGYLARSGTQVPDASVRMTGIDAEGIDLVAGERQLRVALERSIASAADAHDVLVAMARAAP